MSNWRYDPQWQVFTRWQPTTLEEREAGAPFDRIMQVVYKESIDGDDHLRLAYPGRVWPHPSMAEDTGLTKELRDHLEAHPTPGSYKETFPPPECDVCHGESGGTFAGVAAVPGVPMSIGWCASCIVQNATPQMVVCGMYVELGGAEEMADWFTSQNTWVDGRYMLVSEYIVARHDELEVLLSDWLEQLKDGKE